MSHPIIYALGSTEKESFPLILTVGREPNYDEELINVIGQIDIEEFSSMSGGVWVTAYTQIAKQYLGPEGNSGTLKSLCFKRKSSPILFSNAFPMAIPNEVSNKADIRKKLISQIPSHIDTLFSNHLINRVRLVIQHGVDSSEASIIDKEHIENRCRILGIKYVETPFFYNGNSSGIQNALVPVKPMIIEIMGEFEKGKERE